VAAVASTPRVLTSGADASLPECGVPSENRAQWLPEYQIFVMNQIRRDRISIRSLCVCCESRSGWSVPMTGVPGREAGHRRRP